MGYRDVDAVVKEDGFEEDLPLLWFVESETVYDKERILQSIQMLLAEEGFDTRSRILDVSGGIGFPYIELRKLGFNVDYNDASPHMLAWTEREIQKAGVAPGRHFNLRWQDFPFQEEYDVLICMGNSLPYAAGSWGGQKVKDVWTKRNETSDAIKESMARFSVALKPGGIIYVDWAVPDSTAFENKRPFKSEGKDLLLMKRVLNNICDDNMRQWELWVAEPGEHYDRVLVKYRSVVPYLEGAHVAWYLNNAGFSDIQDVWLLGQENGRVVSPQREIHRGYLSGVRIVGDFSKVETFKRVDVDSEDSRPVGDVPLTSPENRDYSMRHPTYPGLIARKPQRSNCNINTLSEPLQNI